MRYWKRPKFKWICPQCGAITKTYDDIPPICRGNDKPSDPHFHLFEYVMKQIKKEERCQK